MSTTKSKTFESPFVGINKSGKYDILYSANGDYSVILQCNNSVLQYAADREAFYFFHNTFQNIIKVLGEGYILQKQDILSKCCFEAKVEGDFLSKKYQHHFKGRSFIKQTTYLIITKKVKRSAFFSYDSRIFDVFLKNIEKVIEILRNGGFSPQLLDEGSIKLQLKRMMVFDFENQHFSVNNLQAFEEKIKIGKKEIVSMSLVDIDEVNLPNDIKPYREINDMGYAFPVDLMSFLVDVNDFDNIVYNQVIRVPEQTIELSKLRAKKKRHDSMPDPANIISSNDIEAILKDVAENNQLLVYAHFNIAVMADELNMSKAINFIESSLFKNGIIPSKNAYNQLELFKTCLPGNAGMLQHYDEFLTTFDAAICFLFKEKLATSEASRFQIYFTDRQGVPIAIDTSDLPIDTNRINNRNKFVLGPSGSGKSFFMNHLVRQYYLHNMDIILVDTGHSYSGICDYYGGKYITYSEEKPITMNPFRINRQEYNEEKKEFLKSLVALLWKGADGEINQVESTVLTDVVAAYYKDYYGNESLDSQYLSFNSFYEYSLEKIDEIIKKEVITFDLQSYKYILKQFYKGGEYEVILNDSVDNSLFDETFIVFEIDAIKDHKILFPITTIIIMDVFLQKMRHKKNRKALIIEEAWKAIASPMMANYILYVYKTVRKFWGEATVVTQELDDIIGNQIVKDSIINNSDTICLLDQTKFKDNYNEISKLLSLNEKERLKIFTVNNLNNKAGRSRFKEVYIKRGAIGEVYGVEVSLYEYLTYTTERKEKDALKRYLDKYGDHVTALEYFISDLEISQLSLSSFVDEVNSNKIPLLESNSI
ncbi:TraG family conjugative transposon ATPase [Chondrinema litorale]|uniref:TraG family conjugative transposon ATPase n=1 Tax=Chondrinema litorale TaxID=2994555 RepID=UPI002543472A|nr:TraG family conjugative transposon ATPase [Chondrinema litorale]UZR99620.1 TraG family conjugative transposon ATPase [Chondrinema litorale]